MNGLPNSVVVKFLNSSNTVTTVKSKTYGGSNIIAAVVWGEKKRFMMLSELLVRVWCQMSSRFM